MKRYILTLTFFLSSILSAQNTDIITLRENNSSGEPLYLDQVFTVSGIVTSSIQFGNNGPGSLQDGTAGISVYGSSFAGNVNIGDSITITSTLDHYNGLTQFNFFASGSEVTIHKSNVDVEPLVVTINDILSQTWNSVEELEGRLIRINEVTISSTGTFSGGTNYDISDATGSLEIRIDNDVNSIIGSSIPSSSVDVIGILGQYDTSSPLSSGYQLLPRFIDDIITENEPLILSPIIPADITPNSFTVYFNTSRPGTTEIQYGKTTNLEIDTIAYEDLSTSHKVTVSNLEEATTYYFQVASRNENGVSVSQILSASTSSSDTTTGEINIYFNYSVDNSVAIEGNEALGNVNFKQKLIDRINSATYSLDIAVYSFYGLNDVANAIISAKNNRGVKVRVVYDSRDMQSSMQLLADDGILISKRDLTDGIMHNKFMIVDARDSINSNDWVWTGSWNWNPLGNRNSVLEINDPTLAAAYTDEFEEMWGSSDETPTSSSKFGPEKSDNTPHVFQIGEKLIHLYFSPSDATENKITSAINTADSSIFFGLLSFTSDPIFTAINNAKNSGVNDIRGIIDNVNDTGGEFNNLQSIAEVFDYNLSGIFHHKYGLIDSYSTTSSPAVVVGSHNWSRSANEKNDENTLIIYDLEIANQYMQEFKSRYNELGGSSEFPTPILVAVKDQELSNKISLSQNYPNPFNPKTVIEYEVPNHNSVEKITLSVFNILGQKMSEIFNGYQNSGKYRVTFDGSNFSSGTYIYQLKIGSKMLNKKMLIIK